MRGKARFQKRYGFDSGITPAYAGKSTDAKLFHCVAEDHPRLCGEKQFPSRYRRAVCGITPAYAGKS